MDKDDYILRSISKLPHKKWELFIITRIVHSILDNECDIEFVCQQLVRKPGGRFSLTDIYFPQFQLHLEIDEPAHARDANVAADHCRERDIIDATRHKIERIKVYSDRDAEIVKPLSDLIADTDNFISMLLDERNKLICDGEWEGWNFGEKFNPDKYISLGYLDIANSPVFRTHRDALRCFGYTGGHYQRAVWPIGKASNKIVWFPKLYPNGDWKNSISDDGCEICEVPLSAAMVTKFGNLQSRSMGETRIVFAHYTDALGITLYKYMGEFIANPGKSTGASVVYDRVKTRTLLRTITT